MAPIEPFLVLATQLAESCRELSGIAKNIENDSPQAGAQKMWSIAKQLQQMADLVINNLQDAYPDIINGNDKDNSTVLEQAKIREPATTTMLALQQSLRPSSIPTDRVTSTPVPVSFPSTPSTSSTTSTPTPSSPPTPVPPTLSTSSTTSTPTPSSPPTPVPPTLSTSSTTSTPTPSSPPTPVPSIPSTPILTLSATAISPTAVIPAVSYRRLKTNFLREIGGLINDSNFNGIFRVENLPAVRLSTLKRSLKTPVDYEQLSVQWSMDEKWPRLRRGAVRDILVPDIGQDFLPSTKEARSFLETLLRSPPKEPLECYVGPLLTSDGNEIFEPDQPLSARSCTELRTPYHHLGVMASGTSFHKKELGLRSCSITLAGVQIWLTIHSSCTEAFEHLLLQREIRCDQDIQHQNIVLPPSELDRHSIQYQIECVGTGFAIVTAPGQYHYMLNYLDSFAISANFATDTDIVDIQQLKTCEICTLHKPQSTATDAVTGSSACKSRKRVNAADIGPARKATKLNPWPEMLKYVEDVEQQKLPEPCLDDKRPDYLYLAATILSKSALMRFITLVRQHRKDRSDKRSSETDYGTLHSIPESNVSVEQADKGPVYSVVKRRSLIVSQLNDKGSLLNLRTRHERGLIAEAMERERKGRLRLSKETISEWSETIPQLQYNLRMGRLWLPWLNHGAWALCFLLSGNNSLGIKASHYEGDESAERIFQHLEELSGEYQEYLDILQRAGKSFLGVFQGDGDVKFCFETNKVDLEGLTFAEAIKFLKLVE